MTRSNPTLARGFSIIELMVAMTLSLILLAGVLGVMYSSRVTYSENERVARLQESGRAAVEMILRDMRAGGFQGCGRPLIETDFENMLNNPDALTHNYARALQGFDGSTGVFNPAIDAAITDPLLPSDVIVIRGVRTGEPAYRTNTTMTTGNDPVTIDIPVGATIAPGTPVVISNCERSTVFAVTGFVVDAGGTSATLSHGTGGIGITNRDENIGAFPVGSQITPVTTTVYYVRENDAGIPSLWRKVDDADPVELIPGIERLEVLFGEDQNNDWLADRYVPANQADINWERITSASIAVLVRSTEAYGGEQESRTITMLDQEVELPKDSFLRTTFTVTASLRNRNP